jgi:hypothetical protein
VDKEYPLLGEKEYPPLGEKEYPLMISDSSMIKQNGNSSPLPMSTFGKDARWAVDQGIEKRQDNFHGAAQKNEVEW